MHASASRASASLERCCRCAGVDRHARALRPTLVAGRFTAGKHSLGDELPLSRYAHMF
jgi:hypothetical protein